jgi:hypothetical protein
MRMILSSIYHREKYGERFISILVCGTPWRRKEERKKTENEVNKLQSIIFRFDAFFLLLYADRIVKNLEKPRKIYPFSIKTRFGCSVLL